MGCPLETQSTVFNEKKHLLCLQTYIYREELNIASLYIYILNVDKINNGLKIMYSAPFDNTKALAVCGAKC